MECRNCPFCNAHMQMISRQKLPKVLVKRCLWIFKKTVRIGIIWREEWQCLNTQECGFTAEFNEVVL